MLDKFRLNDHLDFLKRYLSRGRFEHSVRVARLSRELAVIFGEDPIRCWIAGIYHDVLREWSPERLRKTAERMGLVITPLESRYLVILHGRVGAEYLKERGIVSDPEILDGIRNHVLGEEGSSSLAKIVYVADYHEPGRKNREHTLTMLPTTTVDSLWLTTRELSKTHYDELEEDNQ